MATGLPSHNLGNLMLTGEIDDLRGDPTAAQRDGLRPQLLRQAQVGDRAVTLGGWQPQHLGGFDVNREPFRSGFDGHLLSGADQIGRRRARADAYQETCWRGVSRHRWLLQAGLRRISSAASTSGESGTAM